MPHHEPPLSPQPDEPAQTVPQQPVAATVPAAPAQPETHDDDSHQGGQPDQGWGAPHRGSRAEPIYPLQPGGWGAPPQGQAGHGPRPAADRWRRLSTAQKGLAAGALAVVIAGGAGAAVWAANSANTANAANAQGGMNGFRGQGAPGGQNGMNGQNGQNGMSGQGLGA